METENWYSILPPCWVLLTSLLARRSQLKVPKPTLAGNLIKKEIFLDSLTKSPEKKRWRLDDNRELRTLWWTSPENNHPCEDKVRNNETDDRQEEPELRAQERILWREWTVGQLKKTWTICKLLWGWGGNSRCQIQHSDSRAIQTLCRWSLLAKSWIWRSRFVILDYKNTEIYKNSVSLGHSTNNVAEYCALVIGLKTALNLHILKLEAYSDSQPIVNQIHGVDETLNPVLKLFHAETLKLLSQFQQVKVQWIAREENGRADSLAKKHLIWKRRRRKERRNNKK